MEKEVKIKLHELDDVACANVIVSRQIKRMVKKFPSMEEISIDCHAHDGHYKKFKYDNGNFIWTNTNNKQLTPNEESLDYNYLNKLLVYTYRTMCDMQNGVDISDTPEELLAYAESKLQEMLQDSDISE